MLHTIASIDNNHNISSINARVWFVPLPDVRFCAMILSLQSFIERLLLPLRRAYAPLPKSTYGKLLPISFGPSPRLFVSPYPSWPYTLFPQHLTSSLSRIAHV